VNGPSYNGRIIGKLGLQVRARKIDRGADEIKDLSVGIKSAYQQTPKRYDLELLMNIIYTSATINRRRKG